MPSLATTMKKNNNFNLAIVILTTMIKKPFSFKFIEQFFPNFEKQEKHKTKSTYGYNVIVT